MKKPVLHLIPNAHLDPVWLWDQREGLNEGVATCRAMLDLLDANPDLTFIRGEAAIYAHVRRTEPATFARILEKIRAGRWDVVGGSWIQPDTNLLSSETLCRQYEVGQRWLRAHLGVRVRCGWQADSFGHSAGLPAILHAAGIENFAFTRPPAEVLPLRTPAFWWEGRGDARILAYRPPVGWYGCERDELPRRLDQALAALAGSPLRDHAVFLGLGNHGGGPSQRLIDDTHAWAAAHPEVEVRFSGLHAFFAALRRQLAGPRPPALDVVRGELNFCLRGCYASVARLKHPYRRAEYELWRAERTTALLHHAGLAPAADLDRATEAVLFNAFHDILPGSSIERACDEQIDEVGGVRHTARDAGFHALNALARRVRVTLPRVGPDHPRAVPLLLWNPHLHPVQTHVEIEACVDHRPVGAYQNRPGELPVETRLNGRPVPHQILATEHESFVDLAWRKRVLIPVTLPPAGWSVASLGWVENPARPRPAAPAHGAGQTIRNAHYTVRARPGAGGVAIRHRGRPLFGDRGLHLVTVRDNFGAWGGMTEEPASIRLTDTLGAWTVERVEVTSPGPLRASLVVRLVTAGARVDLTFRLTAGEERLALEARVFTDLEAARIKLVLPGATTVEAEVPGERVTRAAEGEQPVLRWVRARDARRAFAVVSDVLSACDLEAGDLRYTLVRATRYARDTPLNQSPEWWRPTTDRGELRAQLVLLPGDGPVERTAELLSQPPIITQVWANPTGDLPATGSLARLTPDDIELLALRPAGADVLVRLRNPTDRPLRPTLRLAGRRHALGPVKPGEVATFRLGPTKAQRVSLGG
jgi:alpha-mannosidase